MVNSLTGHLYAVSIFIIPFCSAALSFKHNARSTQHNDICGTINGRRLYLEIGEKGVLIADDVKSVHSKWNQPLRLNTIDLQQAKTNSSSHNICTLELVTCPSCIISLTFRQMNLSHTCGGSNTVLDSPCRCDYVWLSEPPFEDVSGKPFCGIIDANSSQQTQYSTQTRTLAISFLFSESHSRAFTVEYFAERNRRFLKGSPESPISPNDSIGHGGAIMSPFFPKLYPRDLATEHVINCEGDKMHGCRVRLLFTDFLLGSVTIMEFYDWNGQRIDVTSGASFRPSVIISTGPSLIIRFHANGGTGLGYKALYTFLANDNKDITIAPVTDCGGFVENLGGGITMMNMVDDGLRAYDCLWLIRPPVDYTIKTHLYLKVITFEKMAGNTELTIRLGLTSDKSPLESLRQPAVHTLSKQKEHIAPIKDGFYVSLRGLFGPNSRLAIVYASFSYKDCFSGSDFLCQNHRCIPIQLNCDGFDHCGDNSDEPAICFKDGEVTPVDRRWYSHTPNFYFPKMDRYPDFKTAATVFVISSLGLIVLISALTILLYRMGARARQQRELQNQLQTINDLFVDGVIETHSPDEPPVYEAPPDYEEVIKIGPEFTRKHRRQKKKSLRSKSAPGRFTSKRCISKSRTKKNNDATSVLSGNPTPETVSQDTRSPFLIPITVNLMSANQQPSTSHFLEFPSSSSSTLQPWQIRSLTLNGDVYVDQQQNKSWTNISMATPLSRKLANDDTSNTKHHKHIPRKSFEINRSSLDKIRPLKRQWHSQDDVLIALDLEHFQSTSQQSSSNARKVLYESASESNLVDLGYINERDKNAEKSFRDCKTMKDYFENLFSRAKYPMKNYRKQTKCECVNGCVCTVNQRPILGFRYSESMSDGVRNISQHGDDRPRVMADDSCNSSCFNDLLIWRSIDDTLNPYRK